MDEPIEGKATVRMGVFCLTLVDVSCDYEVQPDGSVHVEDYAVEVAQMGMVETSEAPDELSDEDTKELERLIAEKLKKGGV